MRTCTISSMVKRKDSLIRMISSHIREQLIIGGSIDEMYLKPLRRRNWLRMRMIGFHITLMMMV